MEDNKAADVVVQLLRLRFNMAVQAVIQKLVAAISGFNTVAGKEYFLGRIDDFIDRLVNEEADEITVEEADVFQLAHEIRRKNHFHKTEYFEYYMAPKEPGRPHYSDHERKDYECEGGGFYDIHEIINDVVPRRVKIQRL